MSAKRVTLTVFTLIVILPSASAIKFSNTTPSGHTIWFQIDNLNSTYATVVYPGEGYAGNTWTGYTKPVGDLIIPATATHAGYTFPVTTIGPSAFTHCDSMTSVVIPSSVTKIKSYAFSQCYGLRSVDLGGSVDTILSCTFYYCTTLVNVTGLDPVRCIQTAAFRHCSSLPYIVLPPQLKTIETSAFKECSSLQTVLLPNSLTSIGNSVFSTCSSLTSIIIPDSITTIRNHTFEYCTHLTNVVLGNNVTTIESNAFLGCSRLPSITLPASITSIGSTVFAGCDSLKTIISHAITPPTLLNTSFYGRYNTAHVYPPCESLSDYQSASVWSSFQYFDCGIVADVHPSNYWLGQTTGSGVYDTVTDITLTALPAYGSIFMGWNNGVHDNPYTLHLTCDTTVVALFYPADGSEIITVHDTIIFNIHDTTTVFEYIHDTTTVTELIHDTTTVIEYIHDTTTLTEYIEVHDTVWQTMIDTIWLTEYIHDTIYIHDTLFVGVDGVEAINTKVYSNGGQIVVEGADDNVVMLYDINGRILASKKDYGTPIRFDVPVSGTYNVKIGNHSARKIVAIK